tara:strand:- start:529 stop:936 length:408 start_codon:yes stop_codon:yes gene_type:complete
VVEVNCPKKQAFVKHKQSMVKATTIFGTGGWGFESLRVYFFKSFQDHHLQIQGLRHTHEGLFNSPHLSPYGQFIQPRDKLFKYLVLFAVSEINSRPTVTHFGKADGFQVQFQWSVEIETSSSIARPITLPYRNKV